jgi:hypothetical protein
MSATPHVHPAALPPDDLLRDCDETRTRRGGPGGQHRNKVETAIVLMHRPTGISAEASERRSQAENRAVALRRLRLRLALEHRTTAAPTRSPRWRTRARDGKLAVSVEHEDYPALVAEALDRLEATAGEVAPAATALAVSTSQFIGLFRRDAAAWTALNTARRRHGLTGLK